MEKRETMKKTLTALLLFISCMAYAQTDALERWLKDSKGELCSQKFSKKGLDKEEAQKAAWIIDSLWMQETAQELRGEWSRLVISSDSLSLPCACRTFGMFPKDGRSLFISLHGGGECPKEVNDEQWMNQIYLYELEEGVYVAPRAPWNTWDLWHREGLDQLFDELIKACVVFEGVNPNKVYLMGYSAGGDGVWRMAPRMADRWAAAAMMAGHPGNTSQVNLMNLPFTIWMGENDNAYDRNRLAKEKGEVLDSLATANPGKYIHSTNILADKGHWMDGADADAIGWMSQYCRNPYPRSIIWRQEEVLRKDFYWLSAPVEELGTGKSVEAHIEGNTIDIVRCDYSKLRIYLNDNLVNLDKKVTIKYKGKKIAKKKLKRTIANIYNSLWSHGDRSYAFPSVIEVELD